MTNTAQSETPAQPKEQSSDVYLAYVRELLKRHYEKQRTHGITSWVILAALFYLIRDTLPLFLGGLEASNWSDVCKLFALLYITLMLGSVSLSQSNHTTSYRNFDYRIKINSKSDILVMIPVLLLASILPLYLLSSGFDIKILPVPHGSLVATIDFYTFAFFATSGILSKLRDGYFLIKNEPIPIWITSDFDKRIDVVMRTFVLLLTIINLYGLLSLLRMTPTIPFNSPPLTAINISLATNLAVISFLILMKIRICLADAEAKSLEQIERDIVLHNLVADDCKKRIEQFHTGEQVGSWLADNMYQIKMMSDALVKDSAKAEEIIEQLRENKGETLGSRYKSVRKSLNELEEGRKRLEKAIRAQIRAMKQAINASLRNNDGSLSLLLEKQTNELDSTYVIASNAVDSALRAIDKELS